MYKSYHDIIVSLAFLFRLASTEDISVPGFLYFFNERMISHRFNEI